MSSSNNQKSVVRNSRDIKDILSSQCSRGASISLALSSPVNTKQGYTFTSIIPNKADAPKHHAKSQIQSKLPIDELYQNQKL